MSRSNRLVRVADGAPHFMGTCWWLPISIDRVRHCFATQLPENDTDIRTVQELMGPKIVSTAMIYAHAMSTPGIGAKNPLDTGR